MKPRKAKPKKSKKASPRQTSSKTVDYSQFGDGWVESQLRVLDETFRKAWTPIPRQVRSEWCRRNIRLPADISADPGPYSFIGREYLKEIIDSVDDPETQEIVFIGGTQLGKTELIRAIMVSQGEIEAAPMMLAGPDQVYAREQREFAYKVCEASPVLRERIPPKRMRNDRWLDLGRCYVYLAWSGSTQRMSGRPCKIVLCSEVDRWTHSVNLARQRVKAFLNYCILFEGTLVGASIMLWDLWLGSDRRTPRVPCLCCGHYQQLRFFTHNEGPYIRCGGVGGMKDDEGNWRSPKVAADNAYYICEKGCRIEQHEKSHMVEQCVWAPEGCEVVDGKLTGTPKYPGRRRGYQLNSLYSPTISFGAAAAEWLTCRGTEEGKKSFFNDWLAMKFESRGKVPRWSTLGNTIRGPYERQIVSPHALFLTGGADVQQDVLYWVVRAWGEGGTSWLVDWGPILRTVDEEGSVVLDSALASLRDDVINRDWKVAGLNLVGQEKLKLLKFGIDSNYQTRMVHDFVRGLHCETEVINVRGDHTLAMNEPFRFSLVEKNQRTGKPYPGGLRLWQVNSSFYKSDIQDRWTQRIADPGFWFFANASLDDAKDYLQQITNEARVVDISPKTKYPKEIWKKITEDIGNHYLDCEVYAMACADMVVDRIWTDMTDRFRPIPPQIQDSQGRHSFIGKQQGFIRRGKL